MNVFYVCCAGGAERPCNTVIESQLWDRLKDELQASGQRCYCKCCKARYKTKFGVMVQIVIKGQATYCRAELPPCNIEDAKFVMMEKDFQEHKTPEALLSALPMIAPLDKKIFLTQAVN